MWPGSLNNLGEDIGEINNLQGQWLAIRVAEQVQYSSQVIVLKGFYVFFLLARRSDDLPLLELNCE